ncbi:glycosyltransferase family 1 protein [Plantactinospora sp. S1510]|uniref:Glycosyltransferase family 1 protein n=1 Tax=Plantactinospora alkalitolerans TaxID=2789879 RepID=A0ABS0H1T2_9ACTN|nr:glycosyltransferase [Plantactinospora alkalitolerans]MBF9132422.1 glycosyltransferase family 1 protein [Plantactinospora alkalitolerans]
MQNPEDVGVICLLPHCAYLSQTSRMVEIHRALTARGVPVRVATHGGTHERVLTQAGIAYDVIGPPMTAERCARFLREQPSSGPVGQSAYSDEELRAYVRAEVDYFRQHQISVAVTGFTLSTVLSTRAAGIRLVTEHSASWVPPVFERRLLPVPTRPVVPAMRFLPGPIVRRLLGAAPPRVDYYCSGFNRIAAEQGLPPVPSLAALLLGDLTLVTEAPEVLGVPAAEIDAWSPAGRRGYRPETRLRCTGPLFAHLDVPLPPRVDEFLNGPGPVIYLAVTSSPAELVRAVVRALAALDARVLVAATVHELGDLEGPGVMVGGVLPSHLIMPRVDLAITAGGQGSVQTAMAGGTPLLGLPLQLEQELNISLVERLGAARRIALRHAGTAKLADTARAMLADQRYRRAAKRIRDRYAGIDGPGNAAEAIIEYAEQR